jgi:molybdate transport system ATP-binding protein
MLDGCGANDGAFPMLEVSVERRLGDFQLAASFVAGTGITALFGRSGSGKTSLVNALAGLLRPDAGRISLDGTVLYDRAAGIDMPPQRRRIGYVFQDARLFPHLTVRRNLLYGRWFRRPDAHAPTLEEVVDLLGIAPLLARRPGALSGGEKQRVAIGRALLASPRLLLMDEPLASLDAERKSEILPYIERLRRETGLPIVYVSHAIDEVARLADDVAIMSEGRIAAFGPVEEVMSRLDLRPMTGRYEAGSVITATVAAQDMAYGLTDLRFAGGIITVPGTDLPLGTTVRVRVRDRDVAIARERPRGISVQNVLPGRIAAIGGGEGPMVELMLDCTGTVLTARITRRSLHALDLQVGQDIFALIKSIAFDRHSVGPHAAEE